MTVLYKIHYLGGDEYSFITFIIFRQAKLAFDRCKALLTLWLNLKIRGGSLRSLFDCNNSPISRAVIGYCLCARACERNTRMRISVPCVTFIEGCNFVTCTLVFLSLCYHCWENFTISQIIYCIQSVKPLTKTKGADFRGALTIEVVKVWKLVSFRSLRPRELPIKNLELFILESFSQGGF